MAFIYGFTDIIKDKIVYIGQSKNESNKHHLAGSMYLRGLFKEIGEIEFYKLYRKEIIVEGNFTEELLDELEKHYIRLYCTTNDFGGLNGQNGGRGSHSFTETTKKKISETLKKDGVNWIKGRKGKDAPMYGYKHSDKSKQKISLAQKGKKHSEERKQKTAKSIKDFWNSKDGDKLKKERSYKMKGRVVSEETKQKLRDINLGKKQSEETKKKRSEIMKKVWLKRKENGKKK